MSTTPTHNSVAILAAIAGLSLLAPMNASAANRNHSERHHVTNYNPVEREKVRQDESKRQKDPFYEVDHFPTAGD